MEELIQNLIGIMDPLRVNIDELILAITTNDKIAESSKQTYYRILEECKKTVNECQTILDLYPLMDESDIDHIQRGMLKCFESFKYVQTNSYLEINN